MSLRTRTRKPPPTDAASENALVRRAGEGDRSAWSELVARHLPPILSLAWYKLGDRAEAEDVAQEAFLRLMKKAKTWHEEGAQLRTWLYRVALNLCIDRHRMRKHTPIDEVAQILEADDGVERIDADLDRRIAVRRCLDALPERQQTALVLAYYQGLTNQEAAMLLGVSVEAVESLLSRGRRALREKLGHLHVGGI